MLYAVHHAGVDYRLAYVDSITCIVNNPCCARAGSLKDD
jgi:hypothetical protein